MAHVTTLRVVVIRVSRTGEFALLDAASCECIADHLPSVSVAVEKARALGAVTVWEHRDAASEDTARGDGPHDGRRHWRERSSEARRWRAISSRRPREGELILRGCVAGGFIVHDAITGRALAGPLELPAAITYADARRAPAIWQQYVDPTGRVLGEPFCLRMTPSVERDVDDEGW